MIFAVFDPSPLTVCINCSFNIYKHSVFLPCLLDSIQNVVYDQVMQKKTQRAARMGENDEVTYSEHSDGTYV